MKGQWLLPKLDEQISSLEGMEIIPNYTVKNTFTADYECLAHLRGISGNSGTHPFIDCLCSRANRDLPKKDRAPCQQRTIKSCVDSFERWRVETNEDKKKAASYNNCIHEPLLQKSFPDSSFHVPLLHITTGLVGHDLDKMEAELLSFDQTQAVNCIDPGVTEGLFWDFLRFKNEERKLDEMSQNLESTTSRREQKEMKEQISKLEKEVESIYGKDKPKLTKKTSLMIRLFNESLKTNAIKRETYWSGSLNGNNVYKFIHKVDDVFNSFLASIDQKYQADSSPLDALKARIRSYLLLFQKYLVAYQAVNHSNPVTSADCDLAQSSIDEYLGQIQEH